MAGGNRRRGSRRRSPGDSEKPGFRPVSVEAYIRTHLEANPGASRKEITEGIRAALRDYKAGIRCRCGGPLWVVGSAVAGNGCFACIAGEAYPDNDVEIDEALR